MVIWSTKYIKANVSAVDSVPVSFQMVPTSGSCSQNPTHDELANSLYKQAYQGL